MLAFYLDLQEVWQLEVTVSERACGGAGYVDDGSPLQALEGTSKTGSWQPDALPMLSIGSQRCAERMVACRAGGG